MIFNRKDSLQKEIGRLKARQKTLGFVPTMGALHLGHLSLVQQALRENDAVVVSIFVNPTQFDNTSDLDKYPRTLEEDISLLQALDGDLLIFTPDPLELYGKEIASKNYRFGSLERTMEGKFRTGHFDGVGTVLNLFFRAIAPDRAYFGEKDFQQLQIVRKLVQLERLPITIVGCPITRESNGLAMSSRNRRLTATQFDEATLIHKTLKVVRKKFDSLSINKLHALVKQAFAQHPNLKLEYFEITPVETLQPAVRKNKAKKYRAFIAAFAGEVRLIDNMALN
jgi:pantoate--beta-alanine ligase